MATIKVRQRVFEFELTEREVCDLVIAISSHNVSPNKSFALRNELVKLLGYTPTDAPDT